jgi:integrase
LRFFGERERLTELTPRRIDQYGQWLRKQTKPAPTTEDKDRRVPLSDGTVKLIMAPLRACLSTAVAEGVIRSDPARDVKLPRQAVVESEDEQVKAMSQKELAALAAALPKAWQLFFWFLTATGLRISEAIALEWRHVKLDAKQPHIEVRQALVKGHMGPPKSKYGRRDIPLDEALVDALRAHHRDSEWPGDRSPVFPAGNGKPLNPGNLYRRVLVPAREEAGLDWVGFHSFRQTAATLLFASGRNVKAVQKWLGHHSASFTLDTYIGLLDEDLGAGLKLPQGGNASGNRPHNGPLRELSTNSAAQSQISDPTPPHTGP